MYQLLWMVGEKRKQMQNANIHVSCPVLNNWASEKQKSESKQRARKGINSGGAAEHGQDAVTLV